MIGADMAMRLWESLGRWEIHGRLGAFNIYALRGSPGPISVLLIERRLSLQRKCLLLLQVSAKPVVRG